MEEYLQSTKDALASGSVSKVHVVMGNEACDLDSAVSSITYAYYLHKVRPDTDTTYVPVLNIRRSDFPLRTEVAFYLRQVKISPEKLTFRDELDLESLNKDSKLSLTLVDHNVLSSVDSSLEGAVVEVVDHHRRDRPVSDSESVTVELVGSCCTLVAEKLTNDNNFTVDHQMAELLYGPVVFDNINLSEEAGIKTAKDVAMVDKLQTLRAEGAPGRDDVYRAINEAKADVSELSTVDVLRKDMKVLSSPQVSVAFCSVPLTLEKFLSREDIVTSLVTLATQQGASVVILMSLTTSGSGGEPQRQLAVYSENGNLRQQVQDLLTSSQDPALHLSAITSPSDKITAYNQGNIKASRKKIGPLIKANLSSLSLKSPTPDDVSPSEDSGVALVDLSPSAPSNDSPGEVPDPFGGLEVSGATIDDSSPDSKDLTPTQPAVDDLLGLELTPVVTTGTPASVTLTGATKSETTTDDVDQEESSVGDDVPDSVKPGGLLDLDFFAPKEETDSEAGSLGSLDDYEKDDEPKEVPIRPEQEVLDLISDAIQEDSKDQVEAASTKTPKESEPDPVKSTTSPSVDQQHLDPFENHEGVLIEASPLQGTTPDPSATPDTSQPTSPPSVSYPGTPPNSYMDLNMMESHHRGQQDLPSFMNADMVRRIHEKKAALSVLDEQSSGRTSRDDHFPFTPQNSVSDSSLDHLTRQPSLPTFDNVHIVEAVQNKRSELDGGAAGQATSEAMKFPYTPPNSFVDSSLAEMHHRGGPLELIEEDFADRVNKKKHKFEEEELSTSPLDEVDEMDLPTETTGNVVAYRIAEDMKAEKEYKEIHKLVNDHSGNVVAYQLAEQMKAREAGAAPSPPAEPSIWDGKTVRYTGEDEVDVATQLADDVIQRALEAVGAPGESLQAELAEAEGAALQDDESAGGDTETKQTVEPVKADKSDRPNSQSDQGTEQALTKGADDKKSVESLSSTQLSTEPPTGRAGGDGDTDPPTRPKGAAGGATVKFTLPEEGSEAPATRKVLSPDMEGRPHSDSQLSDASTGGDSDLSQGIADFVSRIRSDTGASVISGNSEDLVEAAVHMDVARQIVDDAMIAAVDIVNQDEDQPAEKLTQQGEWDEETLKTRMDQLPEQVAVDTSGSTSKEADEEGNRLSPQRPLSLESTPKKRIVPNLELLNQDDSVLANASGSSSEGEPLDSFNDLHTPDDLNTPEALGDSIFEGELDWEDSDNSDETPVEPIPEYTAREEFEDEKNWRSVTVGDRQFRIDMKVIEPYKKVLSHGGYYGDGFNAIIVFAGCYLPDKRRRDYHYVMDNLFLYVLSTLELLVVEDYMVVYFHGATPKQKMPSLRWLKRCYEMIDRRLRKNLKSLLIVHPTLWIKTIMTLTKPFISSKFSSKLKYVRGLTELAEAVPMEYIFVPDEIKMRQEEMEEWEKMSKQERKEKEKKDKKMRKQKQKQKT